MADANRNNLDLLVEAAAVHGQLQAGLPVDFVAMHSSLGTRGVATLAPAGLRVGGKMPAWSPEDDRLLRACLGVLGQEEIAGLLGRTQIAVHLRWSRDLRLPAPSRNPDELTANQVAAGLGVDDKCVHLLINRGILSARELPFEGRRVRVVNRQALLSFLVNPSNWIYVHPERVGRSRPRRAGGAFDAEFWQHARRLVALARRRWPDDWWTVGQVAAHHGVCITLVNRAIRQGSIPAVRWGNWRVLKSVATNPALQFHRGKGAPGHARLAWSPATDAFLILGRAIGVPLTGLAILCGYPAKQIGDHLRYLHHRGRLPALIRRLHLPVEYNRKTGMLFADWKRHRRRFPRLARAMDAYRRHRRTGTNLQPLDQNLVSSVFHTWDRRHGGAKFYRAIVRESCFDRAYDKLRARGIDPYRPAKEKCP